MPGSLTPPAHTAPDHTDNLNGASDKQAGAESTNPHDDDRPASPLTPQQPGSGDLEPKEHQTNGSGSQLHGPSAPGNGSYYQHAADPEFGPPRPPSPYWHGPTAMYYDGPAWGFYRGG